MLHPVEPAELPDGRRRRRGAPRGGRRKDDANDGRADLRRARQGRRPTRPSTTCQYAVAGRHRTSTASCWPGGPGHCSTSPARSTPTRCCGSRSASASTRSSDAAQQPSRRSARVLPKLLDQYKLLGQQPGTRDGRRRLGRAAEPRSIYGGEPGAGRRRGRRGAGRGLRAGGRRRGDLAGGQPARAARPRPRPRTDSAGKPVGSVHGDSVGVHASDAANAWRNIAAGQQPAQHGRQPDRRRVPHGRPERRADSRTPYPLAEHLEKVKATDAGRRCSRETEAAIQAQGPGPACAAGAPLRRAGPRPRGRCSTCCCATPSARTGRCTPRSTTAR